MPTTPTPDALPRLAGALLRALLPRAEKDEVLADLAAEYAERAEAEGRPRARRWVWRQVAASVPALFGRSVWRGMTGFEPRANHMRPGGPPMESWIIDTRYALRRLRSRPLYAALAVLTLALGVGGAAAITGVVRELLVKPLPYASEGELARFWNPFDWNESEILYMRPDWPGFRQVAGYRALGVSLQQGQSPARLLPGISTSAELFDVLGARPLLGRTFLPGDDRLGAEPTAVLSWGLWQELGGDRGIVGRRLKLDGAERTVVGVMPRGFWFPEPTVRVWLAEELDPDNRSGNYAMVGRVAQGVSVATVGPHLARITARLGERYTYPAQWDKTQNAAVTPLREALMGPVRTPLLATLGAMAMILLIACANVASLMLGQVDGRLTELAVRSALGADRRRLLQQLVAESLVIGAAAGVVGALLAGLGFGVLVTALPLGAWGEGAHLDWTVFAVAMVAAVVASLLIALVPVISLTRGDLRGVLSTMRTAGVGARGGRMESGLVVAEVALAVLMAAGAALLVRSVAKLYAIDPGIRTEGAAVLDLVLPGDLDNAQRRVVLHRITDAVSTLPGVASVAVTAKLPLRGRGNSCGLAIEGKPEVQRATTYFRIVSPGYLETMGVPLRGGRMLTAADAALGEPAEGSGGEVMVVVNQALADRYFPGEDPVGHVVRGCGPEGERVVGVVANVSEGALTEPKSPARYFLYDQSPFVQDTESVVMRVGAGLRPESVLEAARAAVQQTAPAVAIDQATTLDLVLQQAVGPARQVMILLGLLTSLAVLLGAVGVYGVISHFVTRRQRDWAIRIALGLAPRQVVAQVARRGASLVAVGIVIGVTLAFVLARLMDALLYGVTAGDPIALAGAALALLVVGVAAALIPAWRASRTHPALLLREA